MTQTTEPQGPQRRSRARRNVVGGSPHRDEYVRLMQAGWSSLTLERYAMYRFGEEIPASTFRTYKKRWAIEAKVAPWAREAEKVLDADAAVDVVTARAELIELQRSRIAIDVGHERTMTKLFGSTRAEIAALSSLLDAHKADLQDLGLFPKAGTTLTISGDVPKPTAADAPKVQTLGTLIGTEDTAEEIEAAKVLHLKMKAASNGHGGVA
jgi:hypothetical protein